MTLRTKPELGNLRKKQTHRVIRRALVEGCDTGTFRICHYSVQRHKLLLLVEADGRDALSRGMQGISVRIAKALNRVWERNGSVFADRYATEPIKTSAAMRANLVYVLNHARLRERLGPDAIDPYSSGQYFSGWSNAPTPPLDPDEHAPVTAARTRLLKTTWRKLPRIDVNERPEELDVLG